MTTRPCHKHHQRQYHRYCREHNLDPSQTASVVHFLRAKKDRARSTINQYIWALRAGGIATDAAAMQEIRRLFPGVARNRSDAKKADWLDPTYKAKTSASIKATLARPEVKAKHANGVKANWQDPTHKATVSASVKATLARPEVKAKQSDAIKAAMNRPAVRAKTSAAMTTRWQDAAFRANLQEQREARWQDPEQRARELIAINIKDRQKRRRHPKRQATPPATARGRTPHNQA